MSTPPPLPTATDAAGYPPGSSHDETVAVVERTVPEKRDTVFAVPDAEATAIPDWEHDPTNPANWCRLRKSAIVLLIALTNIIV